jgi:hypothetical protein
VWHFEKSGFAPLTQKWGRRPQPARHAGKDRANVRHMVAISDRHEWSQ